MRTMAISIMALARLFGAAPSAQAEQCSNASLRGGYGFHGLAFVVPPSGGTATPRAIIGVFTLDGRGSWTASLTLDDNGTITHPPDPGRAGTYTVNPDCTGTLFPSSGGSIAIVVVDGGREFFQMRTNPANIILYGTTKKLSAGDGNGQ